MGFRGISCLYEVILSRIRLKKQNAVRDMNGKII